MFHRWIGFQLRGLGRGATGSIVVHSRFIGRKGRARLAKDRRDDFLWMTGDKTWRGFIKYNRVFRKCHEEGYWRVIQDNERHILFRLGTAWSVIRLKGMSWGYHRVFLIGLNITYYMRSSKHSLYKRRAMTGVVHLNKNKPAWQCYVSWRNKYRYSKHCVMQEQKLWYISRL